MKSQDIRSCNGAGHQDRIFGNQRAASIFCVFPMILVLMLSFLFPVPVHAEEAKTVRVGYYENEVFELDVSDLDVDGVVSILFDVVNGDVELTFGEIDFMDWLLVHQ